MIIANYSRISSLVNRIVFTSRHFSTEPVTAELQDGEKLELVEEENEMLKRELYIEMKRNISKLSRKHFNIMHGQVPYIEPMHKVHYTLKYNRKLYGKYGAASGFNPGLCWMTKDELEDVKEYEKVAYPYTILEMVEKMKNKKIEEQKAIEERQATIEKRLSKMHKVIAEIKSRNEKKRATANAAKQKKEKLIEEVRRHFGFRIDTKDERFKALLEVREKEQKKAEKLAKRADREAKSLLRLQQKNAEILQLTNEKNKV